MILSHPQIKTVFLLLLISGLAAFFIATSTAQTPEGQVTVEGKIELAPAGDINKNSVVDAGDTVRLAFDIVNRTNQEYKFATLQTGIDRTLVYDLWNLSGASSLDDSNNTISFPNLWIAPQARLSISLDVTVQYFTEGEKRLTLTPELLDRDGSPIGKTIPHEHSDRRVGRFIGELPYFVMIPGISPSPSPTLEPSPSPSVTPSPEASPSPTPEPTSAPTAEPTPESTVTPTPEASVSPSPSVTPEPSPSPSPSSL